jgi:hypothetical protein
MARKWLILWADDGTPWRFDVPFLTSSWCCVFGRGCPGFGGRAGIGCCSYGAILREGEDFTRTSERASMLTSAEWQLKGLLERPLEVDGRGRWHTAVHNGACVFANRSDFGPGQGCAFHIAATRRGEAIEDWKPFVCWSSPIRVEADGDGWIVRAMVNRDWSHSRREKLLDWWCVDTDPEKVAYQAEQPLYKTAEANLRRQIGNEMYEALCRALDADDSIE